jgi:hypothetical protein
VLLIRVELGLSGPLLHEALEERPGVLAMEHVVVLELKAFAGRAIERLNRRVSKGLTLELQNLVCRQHLEGLQCYIYLSLTEPLEMTDAFMLEVSESIRTALEASSFMPWQVKQHVEDLNFQLSRLTRLSDLPGPAHGQKALVHYVVETDVQKGWWDEINDWYEQEHLPGLASVPGCVVARRYLNLDAGPRSFACYDLLGEDVTVSPEWLAVRATPWSSKARPHFLNTKRDVFPFVL